MWKPEIMKGSKIVLHVKDFAETKIREKGREDMFQP